MIFYLCDNIKLRNPLFNKILRKLIKYLLQILAVVALIFTLFSCEDDGYMTSPDAQLLFSTDTVTFDTIFTTIGSTTQHFTVHNPYEESVLISQIRLAGGDFSNFRLNINGEVGNDVVDIEIPARDSIFVFVEVTIDPNGQNLPMVVQDSIEFTTNSNIQNINLVAYGQDFKLIKGEQLESTTWTAEKPYLVYDYAFVDSTSVLTIEAGTKIFFHKGAGLYVRGTIKADGTFMEPITFLPDRLEDAYKNIPDQWNGIVLFSGSRNNVFNFCTIKNANIGLQVGNIENEGQASLQIMNSRIENMAYAGLFALKSKISGYNNLFANCGFYTVALLIGGEYEFYHSTIANYWGNYGTASRSTSALTISNVLVIPDPDGTKTTHVGDLKKATFGNCIVFGNISKEIELGNNNENEFNFLFDHCIIQVPDTFDISNKDHYKDVLAGIDFDPLFIDPYEEYNYALDTLSPAKDIGNFDFAKRFPIDILNNDRTADDGADLGAFERIEKKDEE